MNEKHYIICANFRYTGSGEPLVTAKESIVEDLASGIFISQLAITTANLPVCSFYFQRRCQLDRTTQIWQSVLFTFSEGSHSFAPKVLRLEMEAATALTLYDWCSNYLANYSLLMVGLAFHIGAFFRLSRYHHVSYARYQINGITVMIIYNIIYIISLP